MLIIEKLVFFALGIICGGWLVGFIAGEHIQEREQAAYAQGQREGIEEVTGKMVEPVEMPGEVPPVMASRETVPAPRPEEIAAARHLANNAGDCESIYCADCPCKGEEDVGCFAVGNEGSTLDAITMDFAAERIARAWLASHGIPVEEPAS